MGNLGACEQGLSEAWKASCRSWRSWRKAPERTDALVRGFEAGSMAGLDEDGACCQLGRRQGRSCRFETQTN